MPDEITRAIEAILLVADTPVEPRMLAEILEVSVREVDARCGELALAYDVDSRGYVLARVAGGYRFQTHADLAPYVERFLLEGQSARLSAAALETLAIIAYKQPISRAQVSAIRGVNVEAVMRTLEQRGYVAEVGRDPGPGQAVLFGTTREFLERLGLDNLDDLPPLSGFVPGPDVVEALEAGLRPDGAPARPRSAAEPVEGRGGAASPGPTDEDEDEEGPSAHDRWQEATERLDDATQRLDALVDQVRTRLAETEAAVAQAEAEEGQDDLVEAEGGTTTESDAPDGGAAVDLRAAEGGGEATVDLTDSDANDPTEVDLTDSDKNDATEDDLFGPLRDT